MAESTSTSAANPASKPELIQSIDLGPKLSLLLGEKDLGILDKSAKKSSRTSCAGLVSSSSEDTRRSIPLYNILWASLTPDSQTVTIDFAEETSSHRLRASKLSFPVPPIAATEPIQTFLSALVSRSYGPARQRKRAYVLANPRAGPGGADRVFDRDVRPLLEAARMDLTVATTGYAGHAGELARTMDLDAYDVVVACSGDGLPYEIFNGFAKRADARSALGRMPVVMVPCGSGNAMACNLYGTHRAAQAGLAIVKGVSTPLDLVSVTQGGTRTLSFLSQALGLIADLDITTEGMRWMGSERFTVGFLWLVFKKKLYPCDIAVKVEIEGKDAVREHYRRRVLEGGSGGGGGAGEGGVVAAPKSDRESEATTPGTDDGPGLPPLRYGTVTDKLPDGWEMIPHEKLWSFYCGNMAYMAPDLNFFSAALANDGLMDLVTIDGPVSPLTAINIQLGVESGHFFDNPLVNYRKVSAYRISPRAAGKDGYISIDGERVPFEPFQAEVHQGLGLTLSKAGGFEAPGPRNWDKVTVGALLA